MKKLTADQQRILDFIVEQNRKSGVPPTVREIASHFGYKSPNNVRQHLRLIEQKGYIRRLPGKARGIELLFKTLPVNDDSDTVPVPLLGAVAAGSPITAIENREDTIRLDRALFRGDDLFSLRIKGNSMNNAGILDGDIAVIKRQATVENGEIAAVIVNDEATLKRFVKHANGIVLHPENPDYEDINISAGEDVKIAGLLIGILRRYQ